MSMTRIKKVLLIDDALMNHKILRRILVNAGYDVLEALNGKEGLEIINNDNQIGLVLLDLMMPEMDGFEVLDALKEKGLLKTLPVIVLTSNNDHDTEIKCLEAGAFDFLAKPYNSFLLLHKVNSIFNFFDNILLINHLETDHLTGLYNKDAFFTHVEDKFKSNDLEYMLVYFNIVGFRIINARFGTIVGDKVLQFVGNMIKKKCSGESVIGRLGPDTFAILKEKKEMKSQIDIGELMANENKSAPVKGLNIKIGIYNIVDKSLDVSTMIDNAKYAADSIKNHYGLYYSIYDDAMSNEALREHQLSDCMEESLNNGHFIVYLQPKHNTQTEEVVGAEALVRWIHPELGFISPGDFIPLFEKNGFVSQLDRYVWENVCMVIHKWISEGVKPVPVSVNVSRADFLAMNVPLVMDDLINNYNIDPELLHIEVTESAYTDNPEQIISMVSTLRDMGFKIEMDDFGSGYSSLNMLSELPIDILKLDMKFMDNGNEQLKGSKRNILSFIVSLSKWLQLPTIAEGVETEEEFEDLKSMGVNMIQGYYYAKPMPIEEFKLYMLSHAIKKHIDKTNYSDLIISSTTENYKEKPLILVIEDIPSNQTLLKKILAPYYKIVTANNGKEGLEYIENHYLELSCILLDLLMPIMDGFQLLEILHKDEKYSTLPVIITTETGSNGELRALNLGAHSFVSKPYNPDVLRHHVRKAVEELTFKKFQKQYTKESGEIYYKAYYDTMTGLLNENGIKKELEKLPFNTSYKFIIFDVDGLKEINEEKGHDYGDKVICMVAELLRENVTQSNILGRVEGDHFIFIMAPTSNEEEANAKINLLCEKVEKNKVEDIPLVCTTCMSDITSPKDYKEIYLKLTRKLIEKKIDKLSRGNK